MTDNKNKTCIVCSQKYRYCNSCVEFVNLEPWHSIFHDSNCREIFNAVSMYGKLSNENIKERLDKCDLSNKENFNKNILNVINELYKNNIEEKVEIISTENKKEESDFIETLSTINEPVGEIEEMSVKITPRNSKKKVK